MFSKNSGPVEVQFVAQQNARRHQDKYPLAAETALKSTYVDSSIDSEETAQEGSQLYQKTGYTVEWGMQLRKWISNSRQVVLVTSIGVREIFCQGGR